MKKTDKIEPLDSFIAFAQLENFTDDVDYTMKRGIKRSFRRTLCAIVPYLVCGCIMVIYPNPVTAALYIVIGTGNLMFHLYKNFREENKHAPWFKPGENITFFPETTPKDILTKGISQTKAEDYYTEEYRLYRESQTDEEVEPDDYTKALEIQQQKAQIHIVATDERDYLNKDETMLKIVHDIEIYRSAYKLPLLDIDSADWELFFDELYDLFCAKGVEQCFADIMEFVNQMTLARALTKNSPKITILDFIRNLQILDTTYTLENGTIDITKLERLRIQRELTLRIRKPKTITFTPSKNEGLK